MRGTRHKAQGTRHKAQALANRMHIAKKASILYRERGSGCVWGCSQQSDDVKTLFADGLKILLAGRG
ncbi:hypothetical protein SOASR015_16940 [Pectobacterium carotovorum subsp. carotovorum]|nr:hypothetical protein SOASR015_16940 [Pectobacterium carotovorum subsp. carotovorum]GLX57009.1 hypothetical protein Pcaca02_23180 [Pectobacterium carotovorum subsp. carotovorum]